MFGSQFDINFALIPLAICNVMFSSKYLLTKHIVIHCFPTRNFWETIAQSNYDIFFNHHVLSVRLF